MSGRAMSASPLRSLPTFVVVTSTTGDAPVTVTFSVKLPICICASSEIVWPSTTWMLSRSNFLKPGRSNETLYVADRQRREQILAVSLAHGRARADERRRRCRHRHARQHRSLRICHRARESPLSDLGECGHREHRSYQQRDDEPCRSRSHRGPPLKNKTSAGNVTNCFECA